MKYLRLLLLPLSLIYGAIVAIRNFFYNSGIFKTHVIDTKSICVGNLSMGGTGKTPHVDYLIQHFLDQNLNPSTLSRGYGRKTKGLIEVTEKSDSNEVGDESLQCKLRFKSRIRSVVSEKRIIGIKFLEESIPKPDVIILDDAFQHRAVKAGLNILLTDYSNPYYNDFVVPAGNLREWRYGKNRSDIVIVTKCPLKLNQSSKARILSKLKFPSDRVFFSTIAYNDIKSFNSEKLPSTVSKVLLVTGIANSKPLEDYLRANYTLEALKYPDHHPFTANDIETIQKKFDQSNSESTIIVTTEKDYMRLKSFDSITSSYPWFYVPITVVINDELRFSNIIDNYISAK